MALIHLSQYCSGYSVYFYDKMPDKNKLWKDQYTLVDILRLWVVVVGEAWWQELSTADCITYIVNRDENK